MKLQIKSSKQTLKTFQNLDLSLYWLYLIYLASGFLCAELFYLFHIIGSRISDWSIGENYTDWLVIDVCIAALLLIAIYSLLRGAWRDICKFLKSSHPELLLSFALGAGFDVYLGSLGQEAYDKYLISVDGSTLFIVCLLPFVLVLMAFSNVLILNAKKCKIEPSAVFLNDDAISNPEDDCLELSIKAEKFATAVLNNGSSDSLVFGVDSPWGAGKSTFINFCVHHWQTSKDISPLIFRFEPVRYLEHNNLSEVFANELIKEIQKVSFDPYLSSSFEKYLKLLNNAKKVSVLGFEFSFFNDENLVTAFEKLQKCLMKFDRKILVIIDDLDRLSWQESKKILYSIKQSFKLKNFSYVLCYDSENLANNSNNSDVLDIQVFLEKYINIKFSLFNDKAALANLVSIDSDKLLKSIITSDVLSVTYIKNTLSMFQSFYSSDEYETYAYFLGDLRKVKRLINSMVLIDIHSTDFFNTDIDSHDLINLLIIYISYPNLFRKIYNAETFGGKEIFSFKLVMGKYENSIKFKSLIAESKTSEHERFILKRLFCVETLNANSSNSKDRLNTSTRACFNGVNLSGRNLENYLHLIVNLRKPSSTESTTFYLNSKHDFLNGSNLKKVFDGLNLRGAESNFAQVEILNVIGNSANELTPEQANDVIWFILQNIHRYTIVNNTFLSSSQRNSLIYVLLKVLDTAGKVDLKHNDASSNNRLNVINEWIFGEGKHQNADIISILTSEQRLPLGYYDLLLFRLYCSADRNAGFNNIYSALAIIGDDYGSDGESSVLSVTGVRLLSQRIFESFNSQYIKPKRNIFDDINALTSYELAPIGEAYPSDDIEKSKIGIISFILYQLTNKQLSMGVGCGYFDSNIFEEVTTGSYETKGTRRIVVTNKALRKRTKDGQEIFDLMNSYLFDICFNPEVKASNTEHFLYYLLINLAKPIDIGGLTPLPKIHEFMKTLDLKRLKLYWTTHKSTFLRSQFHLRSRQILHPNYTATYEKDVLELYNFLDAFDPNEASTAADGSQMA